MELILCPMTEILILVTLQLLLLHQFTHRICFSYECFDSESEDYMIISI